MSWTLVDQGLSPVSSLAEIESWERRLESMLEDRPDDEGLHVALENVRRIKRLKLEMEAEDSRADEDGS